MNGWVAGWVESWGDEEEKAPPGHRSECPEKDAPIARGLELETFGLRDRQLELSWSKATPLFCTLSMAAFILCQS